MFKRGPKTTSGTRSASILRDQGPAIPADHVALAQLEKGEEILQITSGGVLVGPQMVNPTGHVYVTSRRVLFVPDGSVPGKGFADTRWTSQRKIELDDAKYGPNRIVRIDDQIGFLVPKQEAMMFVTLVKPIISSLS